MKIKANNANSPIWKDVYSHSMLPEQLQPLYEMATNLWWVWNHEGAKLFGKIDSELWASTEGNPVLLLQSLSYKRIEEILADDVLMAEIKAVYSIFKDYVNVKPDQTKPSVAYFSMEYGLTNVLKIYSGGLGVLAGDYLKEASDSNIDLTAVGFLYRYGYFTQSLSMDGQQIANYEPQNFNALPLTQVMQANGEPMVLEVPYPGRTVYAHIWKVSVGRVPLYLMDTDIPQNSEWDRSITHQLYGGDWENRMKQEYLLGIGGILMLNKLGIKKQIYHCNEGHAALINAQRLVDFIQNDGLSFNQALEVVRASALYTVHTPVPAGHDYFDEGLFGRYMGEFPGKLGISWQEFIDMGRENPGSNEKFSMSVFALNTCQEANGVSWLHGKVSQRMFAPVWKGYFPDEPARRICDQRRTYADLGFYRMETFLCRTFRQEVLQRPVQQEILGSDPECCRRRNLVYPQDIEEQTDYIYQESIQDKLAEKPRRSCKGCLYPGQNQPERLADRFRPPFRNLQTCPLAVHRPGPSGQDRKQRTISDPVRIHR